MNINFDSVLLRHRFYAPIILIPFLVGCEVKPDYHHRHQWLMEHAVAQEPGELGLTEAISQEPVVVELKTLPTVDSVISRLAENDVIFVGETHDNYAHHLAQLEIIKGVHEQNRKLAIGAEFFQQPFQQYLDAYIAGEIDEREMLRKTEYYKRWGHDYRLYRPIMKFARENRISVIGLNIPAEVVREVRENGLGSVSGDAGRWIPEEIDRSDEVYIERLRAVFRSHEGIGTGDFDRFIEIQLLWDEAMASRAATYLKENPDQKMVILAGSGHIAYGSGIPNRLLRRKDMRSVSVLLGPNEVEWNAQVADYLVLWPEQSLPEKGKLGVQLDRTHELKVKGFAEPSVAKDAGVRVGDIINRIDDVPIGSYAEMAEIMMDKVPGDKVNIQVERQGWFARREKLNFEFRLQ